MFDGKTACMNFLAMYAIKAGAEKAMAAARAEGKELKPFNGRRLTFSAFLEYMESCPLENPTVEDMVRHFVTFEGEHKFEEAARKRAEKEAGLAKMREDFGL